MSAPIPVWAVCVFVLAWGVAAYWWGRRVGLALAARRRRAEGPDVLVTVCKDGQPPKAWRVPRGEVMRLQCTDGTILVGFATTRPLPKEVGQMLEEVTK